MRAFFWGVQKGPGSFFLNGSPRDDMSFLKEDHEMILPRNVQWLVNYPSVNCESLRTAWEDKSLGFQGWSSDLGVPHYSKTNLSGVGNAQLVDSCLETDESLPLIIINKCKKTVWHGLTIYIHITILQWEYNHTPLHGPRQRTNPIQNQASFPGGY